MATTITGTEYDALAPAYDLMTAGYDYGRWIGELLRWAGEHGLCGRRALDVACGTGKSFVPLLEAGFEVTACDQSRGMLAIAATKIPDPRTILRHDMRSLPVLGSFDLITCIDDSLNHLLSEADVRDALASMARNLAPDGLLVFDVNTLVAYRTAFAACDVFEADDHLFAWRGLAGPDAQPGCIAEVQVDVFAPARDDAGLWRRTTTTHRERHYPVATIEDLVADAGLVLVDRRGQSPGVVMHADVDEERHAKALFLARKEGPVITRP
jgi:SAM-dependent methyltransferase